MNIKTLLNHLGPHSGLNADWSVEAWSLGRGLWLLDNEDGTFALVHRKETEDGLFEITDLGTLTVGEDVA
jgi:hypothetical protein